MYVPHRLPLGPTSNSPRQSLITLPVAAIVTVSCAVSNTESRYRVPSWQMDIFKNAKRQQHNARRRKSNGCCAAGVGAIGRGGLLNRTRTENTVCCAAGVEAAHDEARGA